MTKDNELVLINKKTTDDETGDVITNDIGNIISTDIRTTVLCGVKSIRQSEYYAAAVNGLKPEITFIVNKYEYTGQKEVEFKKRRYRVIRTYIPDKAKEIGDFEDMELICSGTMI